MLLETRPTYAVLQFVADWSLRFLRSVDNTVMHCHIQSSTLATVSVEGRMDRMDGGMDYYSHM